VLSAVSPQNLKNKLKSKVKGALDEAKGVFEDTYDSIVGNSIVPDMVSDIESIMAGLDMRSPAERALGRMLSAADDHAAAMLSTLDRDYAGAIGMGDALDNATLAGGGVSGGGMRGSAASRPRSADTDASTTTVEASVDMDTGRLTDAFYDALTRFSRENESGDVIVKIGDREIAAAGKSGQKYTDRRDILK
jgi:hypothetical protein